MSKKTENNSDGRGRPSLGRKNSLVGDWDAWNAAAKRAGHTKTADWIREVLDAAAKKA